MQDTAAIIKINSVCDEMYIYTEEVEDLEFMSKKSTG